MPGSKRHRTYATRHNRPTLCDIAIYHTLLDLRTHANQGESVADDSRALPWDRLYRFMVFLAEPKLG